MSFSWKEAGVSISLLRYKDIGLKPLLDKASVRSVANPYLELGLGKKIKQPGTLVSAVCFDESAIGYIELSPADDRSLAIDFYNGRLDLRNHGFITQGVIALCSLLATLGKQIHVVGSVPQNNVPALVIMERTMKLIGKTDTHFHFGRSF